jgi:hypothetical protein
VQGKIQDKRHRLQKDARSLDDIIRLLGGSDEIAGYDAAFIVRAGEVIARATKDGPPNPPAKPRRD